jgi:hypothetical protein
VIANRVVQPDQLIVDQLQDQRRGDHLGDGLDHEQGVGCHRFAGSGVDHPVGGLDDVVADQHRHRDPGHLAFGGEVTEVMGQSNAQFVDSGRHGTSLGGHL